MDTKLGKLFSLLVKADEVRRELPLHMRPEIDLISRGLPQYGPHLLRRKGPGSEFFDAREFVSGVDDPRGIHAKYSHKRDKLIFIEKEAEIRHHFYMWGDSSESMDWKSENTAYTPREASAIIMLALAKHLGRNHEKIGLLESGRLIDGGHAAEWLSAQLTSAPSGRDAPQLQRRLVRDSSAILFSDFLGDPQKLKNALTQLQAQRITGWVLMIEDPQTFEFNFKGNILFENPEDGPEKIFDKADSITLKKDYQRALKDRIELIQSIANAKGFHFILQRTDEPLHQGLRALYRLGPSMPESVQKLGL